MERLGRVRGEAGGEGTDASEIAECHRPPSFIRVSMLRFLLRSSSRPPPPPLYNLLLPPLLYPSSVFTRMQSVSHRHRNQFPPPSMLDHPRSPFPDYPHDSFPPESPVFDQEQLIFGPLEMDDGRRQDPALSFPWDANGALPSSPATANSVTASPASSASLLEFGTSPPSSDFSYTPGSFPGMTEVHPAFFELDDRNLYSNWLVDDLSLASSAPVPISATQDTQPQTVLTTFGDTSSLAFPKMGPFSPSLEFASLHPLPRSVDDTDRRAHV